MNALYKGLGSLLVPIKSISFATPASPGSDVMACITYNAGTEWAEPREDKDFPGVKVSGWSRMPDDYIKIAIDWDTPQEIEQMVSEIGWRLGAGYMYRWIKGPGEHAHCFGNQYTINGEALAKGDHSDLMKTIAKECGVYEWEINSSYLMSSGCNPYWAKWQAEDPRRDSEGMRPSDFPGWDSGHPWHDIPGPHEGYESRFFYVKPKRYNIHRDVLVKK